MERRADDHLAGVFRAAYDEIAHEPMPDKFLDLLKQLNAAEERCANPQNPLFDRPPK